MFHETVDSTQILDRVGLSSTILTKNIVKHTKRFQKYFKSRCNQLDLIQLSVCLTFFLNNIVKQNQIFTIHWLRIFHQTVNLTQLLVLFHNFLYCSEGTTQPKSCSKSIVLRNILKQRITRQILVLFHNFLYYTEGNKTKICDLLFENIPPHFGFNAALGLGFTILMKEYCEVKLKCYKSQLENISPSSLNQRNLTQLLILFHNFLLFRRKRETKPRPAFDSLFKNTSSNRECNTTLGFVSHFLLNNKENHETKLRCETIPRLRKFHRGISIDWV